MRRLSMGSFYIRNQLSMFLFIIVPLAAVSAMTYFVIKDVVIDKVQSSRQNVLDVMAMDLSKNIEDIIYATNLFSYPHSASYGDLLAFRDVGKLASGAEYKRYNRITELLDLAFSKTTGLDARVIYVNRGHLPISLAGVEESENRALLRELERQVDDAWIRKASPSRIYWMDISSGEQSYSFFVKAVKGEGGEYFGVLYVGLPHSYFDKLFGGVGTGTIELREESGETIYRLASDSGEREGDAIELAASVAKTGWKLTHRFSSAEMTDQITRTFKLYAMFLSVFVLVFILISIALSRRLHRPLFKLKNTAEQFGGGNRLVRFPVKGNDEFAVMGRAFNTMLDQINELIASVEQEQEEKRVIELQALFSQIQPHFLLNTLNSIKCELYLAGDMVRSKHIDSLMSLLRAYMRMNENSTLKQECKLLQDYVDIMKVRSGLQIRLVIELPAELENFEVPRLILQPFVENAIIHGFSDLPPEAVIGVGISANDRLLTVGVTDNGVGMDSAETEKLNARLESEDLGEENKGVGLANTLRRLRLTYGAGVRLLAEKSKGAGMSFTLTIPQYSLDVEGDKRDGL
ncbi:sensor histidine kinase [Paenibacillus sp. LHD-117]|uniref:sensor histidine kinase n=1 Tax=Paenibacillus sp. LHD-117 TaxID=3071412 RepID=UPI0027DEF83A|nr:sensor histidine kinase [Paenibacillus sp. LHD-117]MDQ6422673.1 sensor histidine kinase [Paenibacillus sp. LHD-117]